MRDCNIGVWALVTAAAVARLGGCDGAGGAAASGRGAARPFAPVSQVGEMRPVMREGQTQARADLAGFTGRPHAFAVGAMAGLDGEVTVIDGEVWITRVVGDKPVSSGPRPAHGDRATLLIAAEVPAWRSITLPAAAGGEDLEALIARSARESGLDTSAPFPFRIEGDVSALSMHVINGFCSHGGGEATEATRPWVLTDAAAASARIVGFYAEGSEGVMTHHGTAVHTHAIVATADGPVTGHIDSLTVSAGARLLLPAVPR